MLLVIGTLTSGSFGVIFALASGGAGGAGGAGAGAGRTGVEG